MVRAESSSRRLPGKRGRLSWRPARLEGDPLVSGFRKHLRNVLFLAWLGNVLPVGAEPASTLSDKLRAELGQVYRDDLAQLEEILGRDLSHWC